MRAKIISFINLKGGVAKTTTTVGTAIALAEHFKKRVLVIDMDPQTNATIMLIGDEKWKELDDAGHTLYSLFQEKLIKKRKGSFSLPETIQKNIGNLKNVAGLDLFPSSLRLIKIQDHLADIERKSDFGKRSWEVLRDAVSQIVEEYDYILIDCPPNMGILTQNALYISDYYIIPCIPDILSTYGIPEMHSEVKEFEETWDKEVISLGIVITKFKRNSPLHKRRIEELEEFEAVRLFQTKFPENTKFAEAAEFRETMTFRQKWGYQKQADLFYDFAKEIMERIEEYGD